MTLEQLVLTYGYAALLVGTFLEGETILIVAGFLAHRGYLELPWVIGAAAAGTLAGDQFFFYLGRMKGTDYLRKKPLWQAKSKQVFSRLHQHQLAVVLGFRFLYGLRTVTPFIIGASGFSPARFFMLNAIGALLWAGLLGLAGYGFGGALEVFMGEMKRYERWIVGSMLLTGCLLWFIHLLKDRASSRHSRAGRNPGNAPQSGLPPSRE